MPKAEYEENGRGGNVCLYFTYREAVALVTQAREGFLNSDLKGSYIDENKRLNNVRDSRTVKDFLNTELIVAKALLKDNYPSYSENTDLMASHEAMQKKWMMHSFPFIEVDERSYGHTWEKVFTHGPCDAYQGWQAACNYKPL